MNPPMNPNQVPIHFVLRLDQVNVLLEGLGKLPYDRAVEMVNLIRGEALGALKIAEEQAMAQAKAAEAPIVLPDEAA